MARHFFLSSPPALDAYSQNILGLAGLIAYWPCNEVAGGAVADLSGNNRPGVSGKIIRGQTGKYGNAYQFLGLEESLLTASAALEAALNVDEYSAACWIRVTADASLQVRVFNTYNDPMAEYSAMEVRSGNQVGIFLKESGVTQFSQNLAQVVDGAWTHLVLFNSLSGGVYGVYIDGVKYEFARNGGLGGFTGPIAATFPQVGDFLKGYMQHVAWFDHKLTQVEVNTICT